MLKVRFLCRTGSISMLRFVLCTTKTPHFKDAKPRFNFNQNVHQSSNTSCCWYLWQLGRYLASLKFGFQVKMSRMGMKTLLIGSMRMNWMDGDNNRILHTAAVTRVDISLFYFAEQKNRLVKLKCYLCHKTLCYETKSVHRMLWSEAICRKVANLERWLCEAPAASSEISDRKKGELWLFSQSLLRQKNGIFHSKHDVISKRRGSSKVKRIKGVSLLFTPTPKDHWWALTAATPPRMTKGWDSIDMRV